MSQLETTIGFCGHVKHGKSTLAGKMLVALGGLSEESVSARWESALNAAGDRELYKRDFNRYNNVFLEGRPDTIEPSDPSRTPVPTRASITFDQASKRLTLIDQPGHKKFIGNLVYGIYLCDLAVIVIDVKAGLKDLSHGDVHGALLAARLLRFFRVPALAVCVSKMDTVGFAEEPFREVEKEVQEKIYPSLDGEVPVVPVAPLQTADADLFPWYTGKTLPAILSEGQFRERPESHEVRFAVKEVYRPSGTGPVLVGVLETGRLKQNLQLILEPASTITKAPVYFRCRSLQAARGVTTSRERTVTAVEARSIVAVATSGVKPHLLKKFLAHGGVAGTDTSRPRVASKIRARILFFRTTNVYSGSIFKMRTHASDTEAHLHLEDMEYEPFDEERQKSLARESETATAVLEFTRPVCIEEDAQQYGKMTRFTLLDHNEVVACGRCIQILT